MTYQHEVYPFIPSIQQRLDEFSFHHKKMCIKGNLDASASGVLDICKSSISTATQFNLPLFKRIQRKVGCLSHEQTIFLYGTKTNTWLYSQL